MGRSGKGDHPPLPKPADLKPGDWTFDQASGAFYVKIDPSQKLADARIEYPDLINGFKTSDGQCQYIVVRNLTVTRFHNDGFNINGATQNCRFENVQAIECGDDGMSAHTQSRLVVDGFVSRGNSTGICHVQGACSVSRNIELRDNHGFDVLLTGWGTHEIDQCVIRPSAEPLRVIRLSSEGAESGQRCGLVMENVRIDADQAAAALKSVKKPGSDHQLTVEVLGACDLTMRNSILSSVSIATRWPGGGVASVKLFDSTIGGKSPTKIDLLADTKWEANRNAYRIDSINVFGKQYEPAQLEVYRKASGQDSKSTWARD